MLGLKGVSLEYYNTVHYLENDNALGFLVRACIHACAVVVALGSTAVQACVLPPTWAVLFMLRPSHLCTGTTVSASNLLQEARLLLSITTARAKGTWQCIFLLPGSPGALGRGAVAGLPRPN